MDHMWAWIKFEKEIGNEWNWDNFGFDSWEKFKCVWECVCFDDWWLFGLFHSLGGGRWVGSNDR